MKLSALESMLVRSVGGLASGRNRGAALVILIFHRVLAERDELIPSEPDAETFTALMSLVARNFTPLPLADAVGRLQSGTLPARSVCITFDDGYANNCEVALPILLKVGIPATVFVAPGFLNGGRMFNDTLIEAVRRAPTRFDLRDLNLGVLELDTTRARRAAVDTVIAALKHLEPNERLRAVQRIAERCGANLPDDLMMSDDQVRKLHASGIEIGAHTMTHPILASTDETVARREIADSKSRLEQIIGAPVTSFAYPNGKPHRDYNAAHVRMAADLGFDLALSTSWGAATAKSDIFQLPRLAPWDTSALKYCARLIRGYRQREYEIA